MNCPNDPAVDALIEVEWARYQLGATPVDKLPEVGLRLLQAEAGDVGLAELAALPASASRPLAEDAFDAVGRTRDLPFLIDPTRRQDLGRLLVTAIAERRLDAATGGELIRRLLQWTDDGHYIEDESLEQIAGYASLLSEYPGSRVELTKEIEAAARASRDDPA